MNISPKLELAGGVVLIVLGVLFIFGLADNIENIASDLIFIGFGAYLIRNSSKKSKEAANAKSKDKSRKRTNRPAHNALESNYDK